MRMARAAGAERTAGGSTPTPGATRRFAPNWPAHWRGAAGTFFPADTGALDRQLDDLLDRAGRDGGDDRLRVLVVPHVG